MYELGKKYGTDKISLHGYHRFYEDFIKKYKNQKFNFLEIGVDRGKSHDMWKEYFPNAYIYGLEIKNAYKNIRVEIMKGNQGKISDLTDLVKLTGNCQIIIDDGSHLPSHQLTTFNFLFEKCLKPGGIYIIEDIETSYWTKGTLYGYNIEYGYENKRNIVNIFKDAISIINKKYIKDDVIKQAYKKSLLNKYALDNISSINFGMNCIIIKKMTKNENEKYNSKPYTFEKFL
tara:strand:- start:1110 stop:1802 length:693 start_codon:yes stop_codon:yes gene_type:complete